MSRKKNGQAGRGTAADGASASQSESASHANDFYNTLAVDADWTESMQPTPHHHHHEHHEHHDNGEFQEVVSKSSRRKAKKGTEADNGAEQPNSGSNLDAGTSAASRPRKPSLSRTGSTNFYATLVDPAYVEKHHELDHSAFDSASPGRPKEKEKEKVKQPEPVSTKKAKNAEQPAQKPTQNAAPAKAAPAKAAPNVSPSAKAAQNVPSSTKSAQNVQSLAKSAQNAPSSSKHAQATEPAATETKPTLAKPVATPAKPAAPSAKPYNMTASAGKDLKNVIKTGAEAVKGSAPVQAGVSAKKQVAAVSHVKAPCCNNVYLFVPNIIGELLYYDLLKILRAALNDFYPV